MTKNKNAVKRFLPYIFTYRYSLLLSLICGILGGFSAVRATYYIGKGVDTLIGVNHVQFNQLYRILILLICFLIISFFTQWLIQRMANQISYYSVSSLRKDVFHRLNQMPIRFFDSVSQGDTVSRFTNDLDYVSDATQALFTNVFSGMMIVIMSLVAMLSLSPMLTIIVLITTPIIFIITWIVAHTSQRNFKAQQQIVGQLSGLVSETISNQKIVKAFNQEISIEHSFEAMNDDLYVVGQKAQFASSLTNPTSRFLDHLAYLSIGILGGYLVLTGKSTVTIGVISSFTIYSSQFSKPFIDLSGLTTQLQVAAAGLERIFNLLDEPIEQKGSEKKLDLNTIKGKVSFDNVYFSYKKDQPLIQNFTLDVTPGETVAIVGRTGAGKSTIVNLLMRFYEVNSGTINIDDVPITEYSRVSLRKAFGMVLQDTWLFDGTIRENLSFGRPEATDEEIIAGAKAAYVHSFIMRLPNQYDTQIGSRGVKLSAGQTQLLTIARTMISKPSMLILDEATSSVDSLTESSIQAGFLQLMEGKTSFVIAHRLSTIQNANLILVMDKGEIIESGQHDELLKDPNSHFSKLYHAQFEEGSI